MVAKQESRRLSYARTRSRDILAHQRSRRRMKAATVHVDGRTGPIRAQCIARGRIASLPPTDLLRLYKRKRTNHHHHHHSERIIPTNQRYVLQKQKM